MADVAKFLQGVQKLIAMGQERSFSTDKKIPKPGNSPQEVELLLDFISGKEGAFRAIFETYHHSLYRHVLRFVKSPDLTADIVQEIFIKVWEKRKSVKVEFNFKSFLYTVAKNHMLNVLKRAAREEVLKQEILKYAATTHNRSEEEVYLADFNRFAEEAIDNLPPQRKLVFKMFRDEGKDYHQIAATLGVSKNTVRDHLAKATKYVKGYLRVHTGITSLWVIVSLLKAF